MAHFCELDENNIVKRTIVVDDNEVGENGSVAGEEYCKNLFGGNSWKQTSYGTQEGIHYTIAADGTILYPYIWKSTRWESTPSASIYPGDEREFYWNPDTSAWVLIS